MTEKSHKQPLCVTLLPDTVIPQDNNNNSELEVSRSGASTLIHNGKYIHSKYDPLREAETVIDRLDQEATAGILLGLGLGYIAQAWNNRFPNKPLLIIEKMPAFINLAAQEGLQIKTTEEPSDTIFLCNNLARIHFNHFFSKLNAQQLKKITLIKTNGAINIDLPFYTEAEQLFSHTLKEYLTNLFTELEFERLWFKNILLNSTGMSRAHRFIELRQKLSQMSAILVGAGPSLIDTLPILRKAQNKTLLFTVDTALRTLLDAEIYPDFVVSLDSQIHNYHDFLGCDVRKVSLICDISAYPKISQLNFKAIYFFETAEFSEEHGKLFLHSHPATLWIKQAAGELGPVRSGGNVATSALDIIRACGIKEIFFAGCDNAFPNGMYHTVGTPSHHRIMRTSNRTHSAEKISWQTINSRMKKTGTNYRGEPVATDIILEKYADWTARAKEEAGEKSHWYQLSHKALTIKGVTLLSEEEALKKIASKNKAPIKITQPINNNNQVNLSNRIEELSAAIEKLLEEELGTQSGIVAISSFFEKFPFMRRAYSAQLMHAETQKDITSKERFLISEISFQLKQTKKQLTKAMRNIQKR